jgi:glycogen debranching enzyme
MNAEAPGAGPSDFYIPAVSSLIEHRPRTLKDGDTFAMFDHHGDLRGGTLNPEGLYHRDTRVLSRLVLDIEHRRPLFLSSTVQNNNALLTVDLTNPDVYAGDALVLAKDSVHLARSKFIKDAACFEMIVAHNYGAAACAVSVGLDFDADFRDVFEVRGQVRARRGELERIVRPPHRVLLRYTGLDGRVRETALVFDPPPATLTERNAAWNVALSAGERRPLFVTVQCGVAPPADHRFVPNLRRAHRARLQSARRRTGVRTSNAIFNELLCRSMADLAMLETSTPHGPYPYAGIPWFSTAFGRDGIVTAIEMLAFDPELARGVLSLLAAHQARDVDAARDAEPGKILHETRSGEMAVLREVPFGLYYGSVDATPLFVMLAGLWFERTQDRATLEALWPNVVAALEWIDRHGDRDGDGFVEYLRESADGLSNQGWKDSEDSVFHADGTLARGSIALCEVQAYVYAAKRHAARLAGVIGDHAVAQRLERDAGTLRQRFDERFWMPERGAYALALDGAKAPCRVLTSNAGHALFGGIALPGRSAALADALMSRAMFSGWGIRTVGTTESRYNPMSYHNGSVWPHDNAVVALGLARYGHGDAVLRVLGAMFDASKHMDFRRLPELFCGMRRTRERGPTFYPVACLPQAWASATPFALLTAALGLEVDAAEETVRFRRPRLPAFLSEVELRQLRVGSSALDVLLHRRGEGVAVTVLDRQGPARVEVLL